jgi:hypothetical protein
MPLVRRVAELVAVLGATAIGCKEVGTSPEVPGSIELPPFPSPAVVVGDTLRNLAGAVAPMLAIVRNVAGDVIDKAPVRYLYADFNRDSALLVDSLSGRVIARKAISGDARLAARVGSSLQVIRNLAVTIRPDSVERGASPSLFTTVFPDTGRSVNQSQPLTVSVRNLQGATPTGVNHWVVKFELLRPANPSNDTSGAAFLIDDRGSVSMLDTTDGSGQAGRRVRIRAARFPTTGTDTLELRATVTYRGLPVRGSPVRLVAPVRRGSGG